MRTLFAFTHGTYEYKHLISAAGVGTAIDGVCTTVYYGTGQSDRVLAGYTWVHMSVRSVFTAVGDTQPFSKI